MSKLKYNIIMEMKKSNKSNVYLASVEDYDFPVVIKEIKHGNINVYKALHQLENNHLPKIYYIEELEDDLLIVEEYVEGELLSDYILTQRLTETSCLDIAEQICNAMNCLHNHLPPIIHRDIKPSNIIISSKGEVKVIDFDSARLYKAERDTDTRLLGTEKYAAPEQYGFSQTDCRSDIYSFGVVMEKFTEFMSGKKCKQWKHMVEKCTLFAPDSRYQSVSEIEHELKKMRKACINNWKLPVIMIGMMVLLVTAGLVWNKLETLQSRIDYLQSMQSDNLVENTGAEETMESTPEESTPEESAPEESTPEESTPEESTSQDNVENLDEKYHNIPPEFRDLESDIPEYISLKEEIREHNALVIYCFKDRIKERDFYVNIRELDHMNTKLQGIKLYSQKTGVGYYIEDDYVEVLDNVIVIDRAYMNNIENGYYRLAALISYGDEEPIERSMFLYVASSDVLDEPDMWLQNTTYDYNCGTDEDIHLVLRNDSGKELEYLQLEHGGMVDSSMYRVLQNGRVMEISSEFMKFLRSGEFLSYNVVCKDGSCLSIIINGV